MHLCDLLHHRMSNLPITKRLRTNTTHRKSSRVQKICVHSYTASFSVNAHYKGKLWIFKDLSSL